MKTILFVEDDAIIIHVYRAKLEREGFHVEVAEDGLAALKMLPTANADLAVLDLMIPKLSGVDVLKFIRSQAGLKDMPVIILSNSYVTDLAKSAVAVGAEVALLKSSCTPGQLIEVINKLLGGHGYTPEPSQQLDKI
jgi:CheY-like chemotaxis protein